MLRSIFKANYESLNLKRLACILKQLPDGLVIIDMDKPLYMNQNANEILQIYPESNQSFLEEQDFSEEMLKTVNQKLISIFKDEVQTHEIENESEIFRYLTKKIEDRQNYIHAEIEIKDPSDSNGEVKLIDVIANIIKEDSIIS